MTMIKTKKANGRLVTVGSRKATRREEKKGRKMLLDGAKAIRQYLSNG
jgi:hypothetical protein